MESLKEKAKKLGLWNMFLPKNHFTQGAGFSNLEYGLMAELLGKSKVASEVSYPFTIRFFSGRTARTLQDVAEIIGVLTTMRARLPTMLPQIPATWRYSPSMAMKHRRSSGLNPCCRARSVLLSS
jgi:hypothetical protein